jgi:hypothetical protein
VTERRFANEPMTDRRAVSHTNGTKANGMPNDSTTCDSTKANSSAIPDGTAEHLGQVGRHRDDLGLASVREPHRAGQVVPHRLGQRLPP